MKHFGYILLFLLAVIPARAQLQTKELHLLYYDYQRTWRFGMTLGLHTFDFAVKNSMKEVSLSPNTPAGIYRAEAKAPGFGINIDGIVDYKIKRNWHLRSGFGICFGARELNFFDSGGQLKHTIEFNSYYIGVPLILKYEANRHSNVRPYVMAGANFRYNLGSRINEAKGVYFGLSPFEPFYEAGFGFDIFYYFFKLSIEVKYSGGITNVASSNVADNFKGYRDIISRMNSRMLLLSFHFE